MTDYTELKALAEAIHVKGTTVDMLNRWARFEAACKPELILGLIAENERLDASFKNFHHNLCTRFGYFHDDIDWQRDQVSLEEHIATQFGHVSAEAGALRSQMETVQRGAGQLKAENEALRKALSDVREALGREYWDQYAGLDETREILDAAMSKEVQS